jgi:hypothetical protein
MQCLVGTTEASHHGCWGSHIPRQQLTLEDLAHQEAFSMMGHLPSEPLMRAKNPCLLLPVSFPYFIARLLTPRCASRGVNRSLVRQFAVPFLLTVNREDDREVFSHSMHTIAQFQCAVVMHCSVTAFSRLLSRCHP